MAWQLFYERIPINNFHQVSFYGHFSDLRSLYVLYTIITCDIPNVEKNLFSFQHSHEKFCQREFIWTLHRSSTEIECQWTLRSRKYKGERLHAASPKVLFTRYAQVERVLFLAILCCVSQPYLDRGVGGGRHFGHTNCMPSLCNGRYLPTIFHEISTWCCFTPCQNLTEKCTTTTLNKRCVLRVFKLAWHRIISRRFRHFEEIMILCSI